MSAGSRARSASATIVLALLLSAPCLAQSVRFETEGCVVVITAYDNQGQPARPSETTRNDVERVKAALQAAERLSDDMKEKIKKACETNGQTHDTRRQPRDPENRPVVHINVYRDSPGVDLGVAHPATGSFSGPGSIGIDLGDLEKIGDNLTEDSDAEMAREMDRDAIKRVLAHEFDHLKDDPDPRHWGSEHGDPLRNREEKGKPVEDENLVITQIRGNVQRHSYGGDLIVYEGTRRLAGRKVTHRYKDQIDASRVAGGVAGAAPGGGGFGTPLPLSPDAVEELPDRACENGAGPGCYRPFPPDLDRGGNDFDVSRFNPSFLQGQPLAPGVQTMSVVLGPFAGVLTLDVPDPETLDGIPTGCPPEGGEAAAGAAGTRAERTPDLNGGPHDCAMIAVANNLIYLATTHSIPRGIEEGELEAAPADIIESLRDAMGWVDGTGVPTKRQFLDGKQAYVEHYGLPIRTTQVDRPTLENIRDALADPNKAVEIDVLQLAPDGTRRAHAVTAVGAGDGKIQVHDPKGGGAKRTDEYGTAEAMDQAGNQFVVLEGYADEGTTLVTHMYVQEFVPQEDDEGAEGAEDPAREPGGAEGPMREAREAEAGDRRADPALLLVSTGASTGPAFRASAADPAALDPPSGLYVAVPVAMSQEQLDPAWRAPGHDRAERILDGYCLEFDAPVPPAGMVFRLAPAIEQRRIAPLRRLYRAAHDLLARGALHPDSDPEAYFHSILQWAIWSREQGFDRSGFAGAFTEHTRKNLAQAGREWTPGIEEIVERAIPGRWRDIEAVLTAAR